MSTMSPASALAGVFLCAALLANGRASDGGDDRPTQESVAKAGEMFRKRCTLCHVPPDPTFEVDRAWLHQVSDTA